MPIKLKRNYKAEEENVEKLYNAFSRAKYELESKKKKDLLEDLKLNTNQHYKAIYKNKEVTIRINNPKLSYKDKIAEICVSIINLPRKTRLDRWAFLEEVEILNIIPPKQNKTDLKCKINDIIFDLIKTKKEETGINQNEQATEMGISSGSLSKYSKGSAIPNGESLLKMAKFYNCSADYILGIS